MVEPQTRPSPQSWPVVLEPAESNGGEPDEPPQAASEEASEASTGSDSQAMSSLNVDQLMAQPPLSVFRQENAPANPRMWDHFAEPEVSAEQSLFQSREPAPQPQHSTAFAQTPRTEQVAIQLAQMQVNAGNIQADFAALIDKLGRLSTELQNITHESRCCICLHATHDVQLLPCMHNKFCKACLERHLQREKNCPVCRSAVQGMLTTFG
ncbi:TPA: hypothetical protein ACH3X2_013041 [Trebouxia sp. C0005]